MFQNHSQKVVGVCTEPDRAGGELQWYLFGVTVRVDIATLALENRSWQVSTLQLLVADLGSACPFQTSVGKSPLFSLNAVC